MTGGFLLAYSNLSDLIFHAKKMCEIIHNCCHGASTTESYLCIHVPVCLLVSECVCVCVCVYVCVYMCMCMCTSMSVCFCVSVCVYVSECVFVYVCVRESVSILLPDRKSTRLNST